MRKPGRPRGSVHREPGRTTTVHMPERVEKWIKDHKISFSAYVAQATEWHDRMLDQGEDLSDLRENMAAAQKKLSVLTEENLELTKFKQRTVDRLRKGEIKVNP